MIRTLRQFRALLAHFARKHGDLLGAGLVLAAALAAYLRTLAPTVATVFDDSLEFQVVTYELGIAHPTGYPLYTLLGKLFTFIPFGDVAYRVNLMSAVFGALTIPMIFLICRQLDCRRLTAMSAALVFAFAPVVWSQAVVAEVYTLNALFVATTLYCLLAATRSRLAAPSAGHPSLNERIPLLSAAFVFGLSLTHHRTMLLLAPPAALYLWIERRRLPAVTGRLLAEVAACIAAPLLLYLYIPIRGMVTSSLDGAYVNTPAGFLGWVTASVYGSFLTDNPLARETGTPSFLFNLFVNQFGYAGLVMAVAGLLFLLATQWQRFVLLGGALITYVVFCLSYRTSDVEVFYIPAFLLLSVVIGHGLTEIWRRMDRDGRAEAHRQLDQPEEASRRSRGAATAWASFRWVVAGTCLAIAVLLPLDSLLRTMPRQDLSQNRTAYEYGREILRQPLEENAAIVGILGETTLLRYFQATEGLRTDLTLIAADREEDRLPAIARTLSAGTPVYLTRPLGGVERSFSLASFGPLIRVRRAPLTTVPPIATARAVDFSGQAMLLGYSLNETPGLEPGSQMANGSPSLRTGSSRAGTSGAAFQGAPEGVEAGKRLGITLYWRSVVTLTEDYKVSVRVVDPSGRLVAQQDGMPVNDAYPTSGWRVGEIVVDTHYVHVPLGTAPGEYQLKVALYSARVPDGVKAFDGMKLENIVGLGPVLVVRPLEAPVLDGLPSRIVQQAGRPSLPGWTESESLASLGVSTVLRGNFDNQITLYGFGLSRNPLVPGEGVDVTMLWRAERDLEIDYVVFIQLVDDQGKIWSSSDGQPVSGAYPTSRWRRGEIVRDMHTLLLPASMPNGEYRLEAGLYGAGGTERLTLLRWTQRSTDTLALGSATVRGRDRTLEAPKAATVQIARFGAGIQLLGYDLSRAGGTVRLVLHLQAVAPMDRSYTVFAHLLDANNRIWAQQDSTPLAGAAPTTTWLPGEYLSDTYTLAIKPDAPAGKYVLEIGVYDATSNARLPVFDEKGSPAGDRVLLIDSLILP